MLFFWEVWMNCLDMNLQIYFKSNYITDVLFYIFLNFTFDIIELYINILHLRFKILLGIDAFYNMILSKHDVLWSILLPFLVIYISHINESYYQT